MYNLVRRRRCRCCGRETSGFTENILVHNWDLTEFKRTGDMQLLSYGVAMKEGRNSIFSKRFKFSDQITLELNPVLYEYLDMYIYWYSINFVNGGRGKLKKDYNVMCGTCNSRVIIEWITKDDSTVVKRIIQQENARSFTKERMKEQIEFESFEEDYIENHIDDIRMLKNITENLTLISEPVYQDKIMLDIELAFYTVLTSMVDSGEIYNKNATVNKTNIKKLLKITDAQLEEYKIPFTRIGKSYAFEVNECIKLMIKSNRFKINI